MQRELSCPPDISFTKYVQILLRWWTACTVHRATMHLNKASWIADLMAVCTVVVSRKPGLNLIVQANKVKSFAQKERSIFTTVKLPLKLLFHCNHWSSGWHSRNICALTLSSSLKARFKSSNTEYSMTLCNLWWGPHASILSDGSFAHYLHRSIFQVFTVFLVFLACSIYFNTSLCPCHIMQWVLKNCRLS